MKAIKKVKKPKKIKLPKLKKQAWVLWSQIVRYVGYCELCGIKYKELNAGGKPTILHAHHIIGRENYMLAWDVKNGVSLCAYCHKFSRTGAHKGGIIFSDWFMKKYPERYEYLLRVYNTSVELTIESMQILIENLTKTLNTLNEAKEIIDEK